MRTEGHPSRLALTIYRDRLAHSQRHNSPNYSSFNDYRFGGLENPHRQLTTNGVYSGSIGPAFVSPSNRKVAPLKEEFRAYYSPTKDEFDVLWQKAVLVFDANALLNLFRYSATTRDEWLELLEAEKDRLWLPHQVGLEFHRNRRLIASQQEKAFADVDRAIANAEDAVRAAINGLRRHPTSEADELSEVLERHMKKVRRKFKRARARHFEAVIEQDAHDNTLKVITALYEGKVGKPYSQETIEALYKEGEIRYSKSIPPGYMDAANKTGLEKYGDLVLWRQILDYSEGAKRPLIFVTDDSKEDWWFKSGSRVLGPRPELIEEHFAVAGERVHLYQPRAFLKFAKERGQKISDGALAEAKKVSAVRSREAWARMNSRISDLSGLRDASSAIARANAAQLQGFSSLDVPGLRSAADQLSQLGQLSPFEGLSRNALIGVSDYFKGVGSSIPFEALAQEAARQSVVYDTFMREQKRIRDAQEMIAAGGSGLESQETQDFTQEEHDASISENPDEVAPGNQIED